jgi:outer membrane translocation and assembly module TamA
MDKHVCRCCARTRSRRTASSRWGRPRHSGRSLTYGSTEIQRWFDKPWLARVGIAGFVDVARAARREAGDMSPLHVDVGTGVRLRIPGMPGALRIDGAHGVRDGAHALTFGWQF